MTYDLQMAETSILALFQTDKLQRKSFVDNVIAKIEAGEINPLTVLLQLKSMEDIIKQITSNEAFKKFAVDEAENIDSKSFSFHNSKMEIKETGVKYHFDRTGDWIHQRIDQIEASTKEQKKQREDFLKTLPSEGMELLNEETGEMVRVYPPYKTSSTTVTVTLK